MELDSQAENGSKVWISKVKNSACTSSEKIEVTIMICWKAKEARV